MALRAVDASDGAAVNLDDEGLVRVRARALFAHELLADDMRDAAHERTSRPRGR